MDFESRFSYCDGLSATVDSCIRRALERAGRKLNSRVSRGKKSRLLTEQEAVLYHTNVIIRVEQLDNLLLHAWDYVPEVAARYNLDQYILENTLDHYCRSILLRGIPHEFSKTCYILDQISQKGVGSPSASVGGHSL